MWLFLVIPSLRKHISSSFQDLPSICLLLIPAFSFSSTWPRSCAKVFFSLSCLYFSLHSSAGSFPAACNKLKFFEFYKTLPQPCARFRYTFILLFFLKGIFFTRLIYKLPPLLLQLLLALQCPQIMLSLLFTTSHSMSVSGIFTVDSLYYSNSLLLVSGISFSPDIFSTFLTIPC